LLQSKFGEIEVKKCNFLAPSLNDAVWQWQIISCPGFCCFASL